MPSLKRQCAVVAVLLALGLAACAPTMQQAQPIPASFAGPSIVERPNGIGHFVVQDGAQLPFHRWSPASAPKGVIIALHGFNDHAASWRMVGPWWAAQGYEVWAYDQRGFGGAPQPGVWANPDVSRADLNTVVALVRARYPDTTIAVAGESMGGALAISAFASANPPQADRMILLAPAVWGWSSQGLLNRISLWTGARVLGTRAFEPPAFAVREIRATDNVVELLRNGRDPRFILATRVDSLYGLVNLMEEGSQKLGQVKVPIFLGYGAHDRIVSPGPMKMALDRAGDMPNLTTAYYPDGWHILNRDLEAQRMYGDVVAWMQDQPLPSAPQSVAAALSEKP